MITALALSPSLDVTYLVDDFAIGAISRPTEVMRLAGGKAITMARAAKALGAEVHVIAPIAGAAGDAIRRALSSTGVVVDAIETLGETRSCVSIASRADGSLTELYEPPTPIGSAWPGIADAIARIPRAAGWLAVCGSIPSDVNTTLLSGSLERARRSGLRIAVDTHGSALAALIADVRPDLVKVNRSEAAELLGVPESRELHELAEGIHRRSQGDVVVTDGTAGALARERDGTSWVVPPARETGRYPVGSGDCFLAGLLTALDRGSAFSDALSLGARCAELNAMTPGGGLFDSAALV